MLSLFDIAVPATEWIYGSTPRGVMGDTPKVPLVDLAVVSPAKGTWVRTVALAIALQCPGLESRRLSQTLTTSVGSWGVRAAISPTGRGLRRGRGGQRSHVIEL